MTSLITPAGSVEPIFTAYVHQISDGLNRIGAPTEVSGRNDITLKGGGKICGNAFYHLAQHNIVHGTMLHDTQMDLMRQKMRLILTDRSAKLTVDDLAEIRKIEATYYTQEMIFGQTSKATTVCSDRIEGCGRVEFSITLRGSIIDDLRLGGDFFEVGDKSAEASFQEALIGLPFSREEITEKLNELKPQANIRRLEAKDVLHILFHNINEKNT